MGSVSGVAIAIFLSSEGTKWVGVMTALRRRRIGRDRVRRRKCLLAEIDSDSLRDGGISTRVVIVHGVRRLLAPCRPRRVTGVVHVSGESRRRHPRESCLVGATWV